MKEVSVWHTGSQKRPLQGKSWSALMYPELEEGQNRLNLSNKFNKAADRREKKTKQTELYLKRKCISLNQFHSICIDYVLQMVFLALLFNS